MILRAPFPWFGGKSRAADMVWRAFGNVPNYVEPFAGSLAVLLGRPHAPKLETANDIDAFLSNFWRAVTVAPDEVALHCDWPVSEPDLHARHRWLLERLPVHRERMMAEAEYFDPKIAGWWAWGLSQWIGSGWCMPTRGQQVSVKIPRLSSRVNGRAHPSRQMPAVHVRSQGSGVLQAPDRDDGMIDPANASSRSRRPYAPRMPNLGSERGVHGADAPPCTEWFLALQARLRRVRVVCGDWRRVLTDTVIGTTTSRNSGMNPCGILIDAPYAHEGRAAGVYTEDDGDTAKQAAEWAREHGDDPDLRIAVCGYEGEHEMPGWSCVAWKALRGYGNDENENRHRERIWFSPHCLPLSGPTQASLFGETG